ncbi:DUF6559 family protein [Marinobacter suaedae]|uniref:DUF6559 family protein n=1 Tax=Marinobacter suaedae TaxID=3057675 RepID=UPI003B96973F
MIDLIRRYQLRRAFRSYIHTLGPELRKRYGGSDQYTVLQIKKTALHLKLNIQYLPYAVALYRHEQSKNTVDLLRLDQAFLDRLRREVADALFDGSTNYTARNVLALAKANDWRGGPSPDWWSNNLGKTSL